MKGDAFIWVRVWTLKRDVCREEESTEQKEEEGIGERGV
jgi:hypothetical protein